LSPNGDSLGAIRAARAQRDRERDRLYALELERLRLQRAQRRDGEKPDGGEAGRRRLEGEIEAQRKVVGAAEARVGREIGALIADRTPQQLIETWEDGLPILLLPLRIETRWRTEQRAGAELWIRAFPDDVARVTHEKVLTDAELEHGQAYWTARHAAADAKAAEKAWTALAERFGANRAAWVARQTKPTNWEAAAANPSAVLEFPPAPLTKPDAWTAAPHTRVLPDRLVLMAWRGEEQVVEQVGEPIDDVVLLGPSPLEDQEGVPSISRDEGDKSLTLADSLLWIRDFDRAVRGGLGFRVRLGPDDVARGFDRLVVIGLKHSAAAEDAQALVEDLIDNHHYSLPGFSLVAQGTPTNNTEGNDSPYTRAGRGAGESEATEVGPPSFSPEGDRASATDGQRLADFLGISYDPLLNVEGAALTDHKEAVAMNRALYAGTLGYYLDHMLDEVLDEEGLLAVRDHFTDHVTGRGPLATIRIGSQPYGILPTSAFGRWRSTPPERSRAAAGDPFEATLHDVLQRFDEAWSAISPGPVRIGAPGDAAANLLEVLGLQPTSAEFYQRVGYSWDYLRNLDDFAFGGRDFGDVLKMAIEDQAARGLLEGLGYSPTREDGSAKPLPLLLQLIWRHYHTRLDPAQLIDGQRLSESEGIKPYDAAHPGHNYVDWLQTNAGDADKLEVQDFGGAPAPGSLLYMMLRFSLLMEAARGLHRWLTVRDVQAEELVRSRKFMNIGPEPSPSLWEVFRAPTNRVVPQEGSAEALLKVVYLPQLAGDEGRYVQQQLDALAVLREMPTARLERALTEHIDTLSYRLDAWQASLFARRLHRQRQLDDAPDQRRTGVYLGAYGLLENLSPAAGGRTKVSEDRLLAELRGSGTDLYVQNGSGGYVHTPSLNHATAAALLRNGYLTHATPEQPDALAVDLSSDRVRRARYLLEGIRNGQSLEVLLGVQFERGLHDCTTRPVDPVILDRYKPAFRTAFPIRRTRVPQAADAEGGAAIVTEDHEVVNGLDLATTELAFPYGVDGLAGATAAERSAIEHEREEIANTLDSLRDVLTAEAAYQLALGNFDRAAAIVRSAGDGTVPPDVEVLDTPRGTGIAFTQRLAVSLSPTVAANPWPGIALTPRAELERALNRWAGGLLGDPEEVSSQVSAVDADGHVVAQGPVTLADLGIQPLDFVYMVRRQVEQSGMAELEARVRYFFARAHDVPDDAVVRISFGDAGGKPSARPFTEALALGDRIRQLLGAARPLGAQHFQSPSKNEPADPKNPDRIDLAELRTRAEAWLKGVRDLLPPLQTALTAAESSPGEATAEPLRAALMSVANVGFAYALPHSAVGAGEAKLAALVAQARSIVRRAGEVGAETDAILARVAGPGDKVEPKASDLTAAVRGWAGEDFVLLPRFDLGDPSGVAAADAARDELLEYARGTAGIRLPVREWLHGAACVRPLVHNFEMLRAIAETTAGEPLALAPLQLPHRPADSWLGLQYPPTMEIVHDTVSLVQHLPQDFDATAAQCGLLVDEWVEVVPKRDEVTGIAFDFDAPNSAPPQALLLAVSPEETGQWQWEDLVETVLDTFRRARLRAVEPDAIGDLPAIGTLLPAVIAEFSTGASTVSLDYSFTLAAIREPVEALMAAGRQRGKA
jgi:hypothetical protein